MSSSGETAQAPSIAASAALTSSRSSLTLSSSRRSDFWSSFPVSLTGYAHMAGEVLVPAAPKLLMPLSLLTAGFVVMSSIDRGIKASQLESRPELRRFVGYTTAVDNALANWLALLSVPTMLISTITGPVGSMMKSRAESMKLGPAQLKYIPVAVGVCLLPLVAPLSSTISEEAMDFAVRPLIELGRPTVTAGPRNDYTAPSAEDLLPEGLLPPPESLLDAEDAAKLKWALDSDPHSVYPEGNTAAVPGAAGKRRTPPHAAAPTVDDAAFLAAVEKFKVRHGSSTANGSSSSSSDEDSDYDRALVAALQQYQKQSAGKPKQL